MMSEKKKILIIDDEPDTTTYYAALLEDNGYETIIAENGEDGFTKLEENKPHLITLDISMPEVSGVKFYRTIKEDDRYKDIPVVIITGVSKDFEKFISSRKQVPAPDGYIAKPIEQDKVLKLIEELI
jgi:two-component system, OmpR family, alkaline phosphatase synthesis response regulator PhoP